MLREDLLLRAKLTPPAQRRAWPRPALAAHLAAALDHRLTLVQAGAGYGKSTALAGLAAAGVPLLWYSLDATDADPGQFAAYLIGACRAGLPGLSDAPQVLLEELSRDGGVQVAPAVDALANALTDALAGPALLVLDDFHLVAGSPAVVALADRLIAYGPPHLHTVLATRHAVNLPGLAKWRVRGEVLEIGRAELTFTPAETAALFAEHYRLPLAPAEVAAVAEVTEGWPIALQMVWQGLRRGRPPAVGGWLSSAPDSLAALFDYLADDVLDRLPVELADFLRETAVLRELTPAACAAVAERPDAGHLLERLHELDLFLVPLGEGRYRYHHLFQDFLGGRAATDPAAVRERHRRAARFYAAACDAPEAIHHWLAAGDHADAADAIAAAGEEALRAGHLELLAGWIAALPPEAVAARPLLQAYLGDMYRLRSRFDEALGWYAAAERTWRARADAAGVGRALRGQALIYLDTVRPSEAETLLEEALRLSDGTADRVAHARLLEMLAENKLNLGRPAEAEALRTQAHALRDEEYAEDNLSVRVKLRTGRLEEVRCTLEDWLTSEHREDGRGVTRPPRAHRETALLLSLVHALRGDGEQALTTARAGVELGERLESPFITAVGHIRMGHAWQLHRMPLPPPAERPQVHPRDEAIRCYRTAIALGDRLAVRRVRAEALWGLTRAYGCPAEAGRGRGDLESAAAAMAEGVAISRGSGDAWVAALCELAMGAGYVLNGQAAAGIEVVSRALIAFRELGDTFGRAAARLWLSLAYNDLHQAEHLALCLDDLLALCETHGYDFLLTRSSLHGPPDPARNIPLLLAARARRCRPAYVARLLAQLGLPDVEVHPGYCLTVQTLGAFRVWRGDTEVLAREWQRDKARQLLQLFLTERSRWQQRDEILDRLWPAAAPDAAASGFKVALNALNRALEPGRLAEAPFAFVVREGSAYRLRPGADVWLDAALFVRECEAGLRLAAAAEGRGAAQRAARTTLQAALRLYRGDYLPEALYEDWASAERERLLTLYLRAADRLAELLIEDDQPDAGIAVCQEILARDVCWERAYTLMMTAYESQGNRSQALKVYERCAATLRRELDVAPAPATGALYRRLNAPG